jgi:Asp-tRNA(Asn)/Glu-tRNA(Gln) amidotransferase A subunit family amidase
MQHTDINTELFENLGKLFYAVAAVDRILHENETLGLKREIEKFWKPKFAEAPYSMAYYIWHAFELARRSDTTAEEAYEEFVSYYKESPQEFPEEVKNLIMDTANSIAKAYADKNKSELILLAKLQLLFND